MAYGTVDEAFLIVLVMFRYFGQKKKKQNEKIQTRTRLIAKTNAALVQV